MARGQEYKISADFETTIEREDLPEDQQETEVWLYDWCLIEEFDNYDAHNMGTTLEQFFDSVFDFVDTNCFMGDTLSIYFHNLKFDGFFLATLMLTNKIKIDRSNINDMNVFYSFSFIYDGIRITFRDSLKLLNQPVKMIAKTYKMEMAKGETPLLQYPPDEIKPEWYDYIFKDVAIVACALNDMFNVQGVEKNTAASEALHVYKRIFEDTWTKEKGKPPKGFDSWFRYFYPILNPEDHEDAQQAYKGGWAFANPIYQGLDIDMSIYVFDKNSMYPGVMLTEKLPYGKPVRKGKGKGFLLDNEVGIYHIFVKADLKEGYLPTFQAQNGTEAKKLGLTAHDYITTTNGEYTERYVTNVDLEMIEKHYDSTIIYDTHTVYKAQQGLDTPYIEHFRGMKENAPTPGARATAKLYLNSLYGKFGSKTEQFQKILTINEKGVIELKLDEEEAEEIESIYTPKAAFITAYARRDIQTSAQENYDIFLYSDTDSIHLINDDRDFSETLDIHESRFGAWKLESKAVFGRYLRAKLYLEEEIDEKKGTTKLEVKGAGMTDDIKKKVTKENFYFGTEFDGKKMPKRVRGGIILRETTFKIKKSLGFGGR